VVISMTGCIYVSLSLWPADSLELLLQKACFQCALSILFA
jgi:hypothetical protein